ncbi:hypothetical protein HZB93_01930 [Candidatus Falkowbacteria bacterium]|nr:hypothetical protein [Candidatus Falkowbacteria bacterium]
MEDTHAKKRRNSVRDQFNGLIVDLRADESATADWLEEVRDGLAEIFGANPGETWENLAFLYYLWVILETVERMRAGNSLPVISRETYERATREWSNRDARARVMREITHALNTFRHDLYEGFETLLEGTPVENGGAEAYCRGAFTKLLRMVRLSR